MNHPRKILYFLLSSILLLLTLNIVAFFNYNAGEFMYKMFNFDRERNIPAIFSFLLLFTVSGTLLYISFQKLNFKISKIFWISLSTIFLFLSFDELLVIHEQVGKITEEHIKGEGVLHYEWLIPYGILLLIFIAVYVKSLIALPKKVRINTIISGCLFVGGAVGFEMIGGWYIDNNALITKVEIKRSTGVFIIYSIEETLEMLGSSYFIYTLFSCLKNHRISK